MIDLYKKVKYAGVTWKVIKQTSQSKYTEDEKIWLEKLKSFYGEDVSDFNSKGKLENPVPEEFTDEESVLTLIADTPITSTFFDIKSNEYNNSNIKKVLNNIITPKLIKRLGGKHKDIKLRLLTMSEFEELKSFGVLFKNQKDWWLEDANEFTTNYAACVNKNDEIIYDCVFYYNDVKPVITIPFTYLSAKQQEFLKQKTAIEEAPPEEEVIDVEIDNRIEEDEVPDTVEDIETTPQEEDVLPAPVVPVTPVVEKQSKKQKLKYKKKKIRLSTEDIERLQRYYEILCKDETIDEKIRASLMDTLSQLI